VTEDAWRAPSGGINFYIGAKVLSSGVLLNGSPVTGSVATEPVKFV
jgi:hypothetical protein